MNRWKKLVSVTLAACLIGITPVQAAVAIPVGPGGGSEQSTEAATGTDTGTITGVAPPGADTSTGTGTPSGTNTGTGTNASSGTDAPGGPSGITDSTGTGTASSNITRPEITAQGAVLMDAATGKLLYEKNGDTAYYPASITKLMTALLVIEHCNLDDTVTFSATATTNLEAGAVSLNITEGDKLTVRQCLYALLLKSANEVANGLAEHVAGSNAAFAKMMNDKAKSLGCTNTNFVNPHGLNNSNHYTTAKDMALIAMAAFQNTTLRKIDTTLSYELPATKKAAARTITMGHKMMYSTDSRYYPGIIGGKTGYTSLAGNTLVTGVEQDGVRLIVVILKSKSTHYTDTKALLDYGFAVMKGGTPADAGTASPGTAPGAGGISQTPAADGTSQPPAAGWRQDGTGWYYIKPDGNRAANEWQNIGGAEYWFDSNAYMATGWRQFSNDAWYYFKGSGAMASDYWAKNDEGKWFYLGLDGVMVRNATTPDGYQVDESGAWIQ